MFTEDEIWYGGGALGALPDTRVVPKKFEVPPAYGTKRNPLAAALSQGMAEAGRRRAQEGREEIRSGLSTLDKAKGVLEGSAMLGTAIPAAIVAPFAKEFTGTPEEEFVNKYMYMPRTEAGLLFADERGEQLGSAIDWAAETPLGEALGKVVEKVPGIFPISSATTRALETGRTGLGQGVKLAAEAAGQKGKQILGEGQDLLRSARADFAAPPTGAVQLQAAQAPRSQLGMYSNAEQAALNLPQAKGTGNQFLAQLSKTPGVKPAELEWTGLSDFLKTKGEQPVTKAEIEQYLQANKVQVNERQLLPPSDFQAKLNNEILPGDESIRASVDEDGVVTLKQMEPFSERYLGEIRRSDLPDDILRDVEDFLRLYGVAKYSPEDDRYEAYTLPNGSNYREILLKLPNVGENISFEKWVEKYTAIRSMDDLKRAPRLMQQMRAQYEREVSKLPKEGTFRSGHFDDPNIVSHMRVTDRADADGNKVLFVEELQSDWGQSGREYGFAEKPSAEVTEYKKLLKDYENGTLPKNQTQRFEELYAKFGRDFVEQKDNRSPSAPFVTNTEDWLNLSLKRLITDAVNNGYDKVAFINGPQSVKRYDLSKHVNEIAVPTVNADGSRYVRIDATQGKRLLLKVDKDGVVSGSDAENQFNRKKLDEVIGKELAEKVMNAKEATSFKDLDLKVGGEGMQKFYDQIVPNTVNKLLKKLGGGKLEPVNIVNSIDKPTGAWLDKDTQKWEAKVGDESFGFFVTRAKALDVAREAYRKQQIQQLGFTITPEMRELVKSQGLPMFAKGGAVKGIKAGVQAAQKATKAARQQGASNDPVAPEIKKTGKLAELEKELTETGGKRQGLRLQRAADEIPGLEDQYEIQALRRAFRGRKGYPYQGVMTMDPKEFQDFALSLNTPLSSHSKENIERLRNLLSQGGFFDDVPFLQMDKKGDFPGIFGHEGRHRARALAAEKHPKTLVEVYPLRGLEMGADDEPMSAIEWLRKFNEELAKNNRYIFSEDETNVLKLPDVYADGGAVTMKKGGASSVMQGINAAKQASKAARRQERVDKNLQRWSGSEEKPPVYYHATNAEEDFTVFDPTKSRSQAKAAFFTPEKQFASNWAYADKKALETAPEVKPRVMPSYLRVKKTFDFENPEHVQDVVSRAKLPKAFTPEYVAGRIGEGAWSFIEDKEIQKAIKDAGFDSFFTKEQGAKNIGVFNPSDIKSVFNRGSFSEDLDISKAEGGMVSADQIREKLKSAFNFAGGGKVNVQPKEEKKTNPFLERVRKYKQGGEVKLAIGGDALKGAKSGIGQALKAVKGAQKKQQPTPAAPPPKREFTGPLAPAQEPVRGQTSKELVRMQRKELNDEQLEALEVFKQRYPDFARASRFMTPQEVIKTIGRESNVMQIDQLLKVIPSAKELSSVAKLGDPKRGWYRASTQAIMDVFGDDAPRFASLLAAMSPQTSVESNLINTLNTWKNWTAAGRPTDAKAIRQIMGSSVQGTKGEESVLEAWAANASRVLSADDPLKVTLSGPKVDSFYRNLADDVYRVTNDAWMAGGLGVGQELFSGSPTAVQLMRGDPGLTPGYIGTSARVREAGQMANMLPSEAQETTWSVYMPLYEMQGQTGLRARDIIQRGLLTPDVIRGTPDFATLLKNPEYARVLEEAGYGQQLAGLRPTPFSTRGPSLSLSEQREVERAAERLEDLKEGRGRESRAKTISLPKQGKPESAFAYSTFETIPGRGVGHLEGLIEEDIGKRKHFSSRAAAPFRDLQGRDVLQGALGLKPLETRTMTGVYRPEGTVRGTPYRQSLETQPGFASGVEVPITGGLKVPKRVQEQLTAAEAVRGLMTAQRGSPWNVQIPTARGESMLALPERKGTIDPEALRYSGQLMPFDEGFMADTGQGVAVVPFGNRLTDPERTLIAERMGAKRFVPTTNVSDYVDYSQELTGPQGTGAATRKMFSLIDPLTGKQKGALSEAAQKPAGELYELYEQTAKSRNEPTREDLMNFLRILRDKGLPGLAAALASGQALPAEEETRKAGGLAALR